MIGIDLFAGAGGMTLGALQAGIDVKYAIEYDYSAALTYSYNNPNVKMINEDIRKVKSIDIKKGKNQLVLFGGPPCQGFSTSNQKTRTKLNPNNWLFSEFIRLIKLLKPEWVIFENVKGFKTTNKGIFYSMTLEKIEKLGYTTSSFVLNAADFGVPQKRERVIVVGSINGLSIESIPGKNKIITVKEALSDLPLLKNGANECIKKYRREPKSEYAKKMRGKKNQSTNNLVSKNSEEVIKRYSYIPQGGNWTSIPSNLMNKYSNKENCHSGIFHRLNNNDVSVVIGNYRKNMLIHPTQDRGLSVREAARLQSFPDWYKFYGNLGSQQQQVGNAVPVLLARSLFKNIMKQINVA